MACLWVAKFQSWIRDHHSHNYKYTIGVKLGSLRVSENQRSEHDMLFQFTRRKPIKKWKLLDTFLMLWLKQFIDWCLVWKVPQVIFDKLMINIGLYQRKHGFLTMELGFPVFIFCMEQSFIKAMCEKNVKEV